MSAARQPGRLASGGLIDRDRPLSFSFDGRPLAGFAGDTLASALLAEGARLVGRSFKYHRPRGVLTAGSEEPNALVELRGGAWREPNTRATMVELFDGLEALSQNRWPSLRFDVASVNSLLSPFLAAGFYYKTFMWPPKFWEAVYEPLIRRAAGLGRSSGRPDPDNYETMHAFCDVLVIGAGPAGLAAALVAARAGARIILADEDFLPGGRLNAETLEIEAAPGALWAAAVAAELASLPNCTVLGRTTVFGVYDGGVFGAIERVADHLAETGGKPRQRLWKIVAKRSVLAAGAIERPIVFGGNDRPGVMMASATRTYVNRFAVTPARSVVLFTTCDDGWRCAADLSAAGIEVKAVVEARDAVDPAVAATAAAGGARLVFGAALVDVVGGRDVRSVGIRDRHGRISYVATEAVAMAGGWNPALALSTHLGGKPRWNDDVAAYVPADTPPGMLAVGAAAGSFSLTAALREGAAAGAVCAQSVGRSPTAMAGLRTSDEAVAVSRPWHVADSRGKAFVDFQNDVTADDLALAAREGFRSPELAKRYTTLGMATDQGKTSNVNGHAILATLAGVSVRQIGTTVARPPYTPVAMSALAGIHRGRHLRPTRLTAGHAWAREQGAAFVESGLWLRARWFARPGEADWLATVTREARAVRDGVGVCDVSTLGKIDVQGVDAGAWLDRIYANTISTLAVGKVRYGLMLREDGFVLDDGTVARLADDHYVVSTTTVNAVRVMQHLEHARQVLWPELDVQIVSVTEQWAQYALAGPHARRLLQNLLGEAVDVSNEALPYMGCVEFAWNDVPARLYRISFSGELAYELAVPARFGDATVRAIMAAGAGFAVVPYGVEALNVLRIEKGHPAGAELNGTTTAGDLGFARMLATGKDFIGAVLARREALTASSRPVLVGLRPVDRAARLTAGAHLLDVGARATLEYDQGYVTSVAFSPALDHWIGLGFLSHGRDRIGQRIRVHDPVRGGDLVAEICAPVFLDPEGKRLRG